MTCKYFKGNKDKDFQKEKIFQKTGEDFLGFEGFEGEP